MARLKRNAIRCRSCKDIIESKHRHHFVTCTCGDVSVDGGLAYEKVRSVDGASWDDLYEYEEEGDDPDWLEGDDDPTDSIDDAADYRRG